MPDSLLFLSADRLGVEDLLETEVFLDLAPSVMGVVTSDGGSGLGSVPRSIWFTSGVMGGGGGADGERDDGMRRISFSRSSTFRCGFTGAGISGGAGEFALDLD